MDQLNLLVDSILENEKTREDMINQAFLELKKLGDQSSNDGLDFNE